jgi:hypothetical protein
VPAAPSRDCSGIADTVEVAGPKLKRTASETSLEEAQDLVRRAKSALDAAATASGDCGCDSAQSQFDDAATRARVL